MEIDTGASLLLLSETTWKHHWPNKRLLPPTVKLRTYTDEPLSVRGSMLARVKHGRHEAQLSLLVVKGEGPSLFNRPRLVAAAKIGLAPNPSGACQFPGGATGKAF